MSESATTSERALGWACYYPPVTEPYPTFPIVGYFIEAHPGAGDWPAERNRSLLSFWLGREAIPECLQ